jgi:hypothetical protein
MAEGVGLGYILEPEWADDEVQGRAPVPPVRAPVPDRQAVLTDRLMAQFLSISGAYVSAVQCHRMQTGRCVYVVGRLRSPLKSCGKNLQIVIVHV